MKAVFILNEPPYGSERTYNGLRLAGALAKNPGNTVRIFLMGDAVVAGKRDQKPPSGFYNIALMLDRVLKANGAFKTHSRSRPQLRKAGRPTKQP